MSDDAKMTVTINRATLKGVKRGGKWWFECKRWPELAKEFSGAESASNAVAEFTRRAIGGVVTVKELAEGEG